MPLSCLWHCDLHHLLCHLQQTAVPCKPAVLLQKNRDSGISLQSCHEGQHRARHARVLFGCDHSEGNTAQVDSKITSNWPYNITDSPLVSPHVLYIQNTDKGVISFMLTCYLPLSAPLEFLVTICHLKRGRGWWGSKGHRGIDQIHGPTVKTRTHTPFLHESVF